MSPDDGEGGDKNTVNTPVWRRFLPLIVIVAAMVVVWQMGLHKYLSLEALVAHRAALETFIAENFALALLAFMGSYIVAVALSLPGAVILTIAGGLLFGWAIGGTATVLAATIGATLIFLAAKTSLGESLRSKAGPFLDKLATGFAEDAFNYLLFLRLVPAFPFWLINLAPAFLGVSLRTFFGATLIGIIPGTFAFSYFGTGLGSVIEAQKSTHEACLAGDPSGTNCAMVLDFSTLITPHLIGSFVALGVVALIPVAIKKLRERRSAG